MSSASIRQISNGFVISSPGTASIPPSLYAATIAEVPYWLNKILDPVTSSPSTMPPTTMPAGGQVSVANFSSGGFLVTENRSNGVIETYCANMDAVADLLNEIFTPVEPPAG